MVLVAFSLLSGCGVSNTSINRDASADHVIEFQHGFERDSVHIICNGKSVLDGAVLTTGRMDGYTGTVISVFQQRLRIAVVHEGDTTFIKVPKADPILINVRVGGISQAFLVDTIKSKYVGISLDKASRSFYILKSDMPFAYD